MTRTENLLRVTKRLILFTLCCVIALGGMFGATLFFEEKFMVSWVCLGCGVLGGFVSIQQRLKDIGDEELTLLSESVFQIALIPIYGGIFALVLYVGFLSGIVRGDLFPEFSIPTFSKPMPTTEDLQRFFRDTYPVSGADTAKLLFWCFVAGFSERFVPQIIGKQSG
jgi:hypothetical protein